VLAAVSTGHKIGMLAVAGLFIAFALFSSFVAPRYWPDFPGARGKRAYIAATLAIFLTMILAVEFFAVEEEEAEGAEAAQEEQGPTGASGAGRSVKVSETEFRIALPETELPAGSYEFQLENDGEIGHDLTIEGPGVDDQKTPVIGPKETATLKVVLEPGTYTFYCSVPGHREGGMETKVEVSEPG
jgi:plastocyanin